MFAADSRHTRGCIELMGKTALGGGGDGGSEGKRWARDRDDRIGVPPSQRACGAGVQAGGVLGARVRAGRIPSLTKARATSTG
jgi:hypothetical protein